MWGNQIKDFRSRVTYVFVKLCFLEKGYLALEPLC